MVTFEIGQIKPILSFNVSNDDELREVLFWISTQTFLKEIHQHEGSKFDFPNYRLQLLKGISSSNLIKNGSKTVPIKDKVTHLKETILRIKWYIIKTIKYGVPIWAISLTINFQSVINLDQISLITTITQNLHGVIHWWIDLAKHLQLIFRELLLL